MRNLFEEASFNEINNRVNNLSAESPRQWGKMNVAQMLAHCKKAFYMPLSEKKLPRSMMGLLIGWAFKKKLYNDDPWKKNLPTSPAFIVKDDRNFDKEKQELLDLVKRFYTAGPEKVGRHPHPMFGTFTLEQWGMAMYKHLDHHLQQFGV